jgi:predicted kinase
MELIIFIGIQGSGKTTFYRERFFTTHLRINLDMLRTRRREGIIFRACLEAGQRMVIDNTNPTAEDRQRYIPFARAAGFRIIGYSFRSGLRESLARNLQREGKEVIPEKGVRATRAKLQAPAFEEGFDALYSVCIDRKGHFQVREWEPAAPESPDIP